MALPDRIRERFFHRDNADQEYTTLNLPKLVGAMAARIDRLQNVAQRIDEVLNSSPPLPPNQQQQRLQRASEILIKQLSWLDDMSAVLERTVSPDA